MNDTYTLSYLPLFYDDLEEIVAYLSQVILSPEETMERFMKRRDELDRIMDEKLAEIKSLLEVKG